MNRMILGAAMMLIAVTARPQSQPLVFTNQSASISIPGVTLYQAATGGGANFVAVGSDSTVVIGTYNGYETQWTNISVPTLNQTLDAITSYGTNSYLAGGTNGNLFVTTDLTNWTRSASLTNSAPIYGLAYSSFLSTFVAAADENIYSSTNLSTWGAGKFSPAKSTEFFFGATAYSKNGRAGFVACGYNGGVRRSIDGITWSNTFSPATTVVLAGAVSDQNQIVCVGTTDKSTTVGGSVYASNAAQIYPWTNNATPVSALNSVAFTGMEYLAVGNNGYIVSSPNGRSWSPNLFNGSTNLNLYGLAFATNGVFQGVGLVVGENGSIFLAGTNPLPPTLVEPTNYFIERSDMLSNVTVSVASNASVSSWITVDWYVTNTTYPKGTKLAPSTLTLTSSVLSNFLKVPYTNNSSTNIFYAYARDTRTQLMSTSPTPVTLVVDPPPSAQIIGGTNTICNGQTSSFTLVLNGHGPWILAWATTGLPSEILLPTSAISTNPSGYGPFTTNISFYSANTNLDSSITNTCTLTDLIGAHGAPEFEVTAPSTYLPGSAVVVVDATPSAEINGGTGTTTTTICNESSNTFSLTLHGHSPWNLTWATTGLPSVVPLPTAETNLASNYGPFTITVPFYSANPNLDISITNTCALTGLTGGTNDCQAASGDLPGLVTVTIDATPSATINNGTNTICNGSPSDFTLVLHGHSPWNLTWTNTGLPSAVPLPTAETNLTSNYGPYVITVPFYSANTNLDSSITNTCTLTSLTAGTDVCQAPSSDLPGRAMVTVDATPSAQIINGTNTTCDGHASDFTLVLHGHSPWNLTWTNTGLPSLVPLPTAETNLTSNYGPFTVTVPFYSTNTNIDISITNTCAIMSLTGGTNDCPAASGDLPGRAMVTVDATPSAEIVDGTGTNTICNGYSNAFSLTLHGHSPWNLTWTSTGLPSPVSLPTAETNLTSNYGPFTVSIPFYSANTNLDISITNTCTLTSLTGGTNDCPAGSGDLPGPAVVVVDATPSAEIVNGTGTNTICNGSTSDFTLVLHGRSPWILTWTNTGLPSLVPLPTGETNLNGNYGPITNIIPFYSANPNLNNSITDTCTLTSLTAGTKDCPAPTADLPGQVVVTVDPTPSATITNGSATICNGNTNAFTLTLNGHGPWTMMWTNFGPPLAVPLPAETNSTTSYGPFTISVPFYSTNTELYSAITNTSLLISLTGANVSGDNGCGVLAPSTNLIGEAAVISYPIPTANVLADVTNICNGESYVVTAQLGGIGPWTVTWWDGTNETVTNYTTTNATLVVSPTNLDPNAVLTTTYTITNLVTANDSCSNVINGSLTLIVDPYPSAQLSLIGATNVPAGQTVTNQVVLTGVGPWMYTGSDGNTITVTNLVDGPFTNLVAVPLTFTNTGSFSETYSYYLTSVSIGGLCPSTNVMGTNTVTVWNTNYLSATQSGTNLSLEFWSTTNLNLEMTTNLVAPESNIVWTVIATNLLGFTNVSVTNIVTNPAAFFRLTTGTN